MQETILKVKDLNVHYGVIRALKGISFEVRKGEIVALIGSNGAGKTTTLQAISGLIPTSSGSILYGDTELTKIPGHRVVGMGIAQVPEGRRVFSGMTVLQNLKMGAYTRKDAGETEQMLNYVYEHFPRLKERRNQIAGTLSGGEQQMLAMGRALMSRPKILLMDEPSMGLSPLLVTEIFSIITTINAEGVTVLLVEQNAKKALSVANYAYVLETGNISLFGEAKELLNDPKIKKAYLGE